MSQASARCAHSLSVKQAQHDISLQHPPASAGHTRFARFFFPSISDISALSQHLTQIFQQQQHMRSLKLIAALAVIVAASDSGASFAYLEGDAQWHAAFRSHCDPAITLFLHAAACIQDALDLCPKLSTQNPHICTLHSQA